jgi:GTP pyrophosphokinase
MPRLRLTWPAALRALVRRHEAAHPEADVDVVVRAYRTAEAAHQGQYRMSGEPYLEHSLGVARTLAEFGMDSSTVAAALMHGIVEHTATTLDEIRAGFGPSIAAIVGGVTRLGSPGEPARAQAIRKLVVAMAEEPRVLLVRLADELQNMRTVAVLPPADREQRANEALDILVPLAHRLGLGVIGRELADIAFGILRPDDFEAVRNLIATTPPDDEILVSLRNGLAAARIRAGVDWDPPQMSAIHRDSSVAGPARFARVLVSDATTCYEALAVVHSLWRPVSGSFRDTIAVPESRNSRSLRTQVVGPAGRTIGVQILSHTMHREAEYGAAALWHVGGDPATWLQYLLDWQRQAADPDDFLDGLRFALGAPQISVFVRGGQPVTVPVGSTPVDLAYAVDTQLGDECTSVRVNDALVPLGSPLADGDVVDFSTSPGSGPSAAWLAFVVTPLARAKIQDYLARSPAAPHEPRDSTSAPARPPAHPRPFPRETSHAVDVPSVPTEWVHIALCCTPVPGEPVFGFLSRNVVRVHRTDCREGRELRENAPQRVVEATWRLDTTSPAFLVALQVEALTGHRMLSDITRVLSELGAMIVSAEVTTTAGLVMTIHTVVEMTDPNRLEEVIGVVRAIDGVYDVYRENQSR